MKPYWQKLRNKERGWGTSPYKRNKIMIDCSSYHSCDAPLCPLDPEKEKRVWFADEQVCTGRAGSGVRFVVNQRKLARLNRPGYFTTAMLDRNIRITKGIAGIDPDAENNVIQARVKRWIANRPGLSESTLQGLRRRGRKLSQNAPCFA